MKRLILITVSLACMAGIVLWSCIKPPFDEPAKNQPPIAIAGVDLVITLPVNTFYLDGFASRDPDCSVVSYQWAQVGGNGYCTIENCAAVKTLVHELTLGVYQFELTVTDDGGRSAKDTIQVTVRNQPGINLPPVAHAGDDFLVTLPYYYAQLNGSKSYDPDGVILSYWWSKVSGPVSYSFYDYNMLVGNNISYDQNPLLGDLVEGVYQFELMVMDTEGATAKDTVVVTVKPEGQDMGRYGKKGH